MRRKEAIIRFLAKIGRADYIQIATYIGASLTTTSTQLTNLKRSGLVQNIKWRDGSRLWVLTQEGQRRYDYYEQRDRSGETAS